MPSPDAGHYCDGHSGQKVIPKVTILKQIIMKT